ncbi:MAG: LAGLIDADG family homing endonuclease [Pyrobaculum sp.]
MGLADRMYIAGVVLGDGMLAHHRRRGYEVKITDKSEAYIRYLAELVYQTYGVRPRVSKDSRRNAWRLRSFRKALYEAILEDIRAAKQNPDRHVVGGLYDAEGYWNPHKKKLTFTNKDADVITLVQQFLSQNSIQYTTYERKKGVHRWYVVETHTAQARRLLSILDLRHPKWGTSLYY